tara:strand:- start:2134 stop:2271 length:138 start_codon:yes stop_codon:yes gene_type:complete
MDKTDFTNLKRYLTLLDNCIGSCNKATEYAKQKVWQEVERLEGEA